jgi:glucokinase
MKTTSQDLSSESTALDEVLALDLGGSKLALACVDRQGTLVLHRRTPTADIKSGQELVDWITSEVAQWNIAPRALGISAGGPLDDERGMITRWPRMEMLWNFPLTDSLSRALPSLERVSLVNDACAACAGEVLFGAAVGLRRVLYLTISTGIGGGAVVGGILLRGDRGNVAEFGHTVVKPEGPFCDCGQQGCLEAMAAASGLYHRYVAAGILAPKERGWADLGYWLKERLDAGDAAVLPIWEEGLDSLAVGIVNLWNSFVPQTIVLGGGLSSLVQASLQTLQARVEARARLIPIPAEGLRFSENRHTTPLLGVAGVAGGWIAQEC